MWLELIKYVKPAYKRIVWDWYNWGYASPAWSDNHLILWKLHSVQIEPILGDYLMQKDEKATQTEDLQDSDTEN